MYPVKSKQKHLSFQTLANSIHDFTSFDVSLMMGIANVQNHRLALLTESTNQQRRLFTSWFSAALVGEGL